MTAAHAAPLVTIRVPAVPAWRASGRSKVRWRPRYRRRTRPGSSDAVAVFPVSFWRGLLEKRWQARLAQVTELSVAFYQTGERSGAGTGGGGASGADAAAGRELRRLQRRTAAARRALADTEEALGRLAAGSYGRCEQCAADIPARWLTSRPEARYCPRCSRPGPARAPVRPDAESRAEARARAWARAWVTAGIKPTRRPA
jgi:RNA polymerase-binding transcription factor DksA